jgi:hypothetical protein
MDQTLTCIDCGQSFTFSAGEQKYFAARNFTPPKRCPVCRAPRRAAKRQAAVARAKEALDDVIRREDDDLIVLMEG